MGTPKLLRGADDGLGSLSVREVVESALEQEDIMPVVRLVFDAPASTDSAAQNGREAHGAVDSGSEGDHEDTSEASDDDGDTDQPDTAKKRRQQKKESKETAASKMQAVLKMLHKVSEEQVEEIGQVCRSNVDEIASSMHHLDDMQDSVDELRERMAQAHGDHQEAGDGLIKLLEMLQEASRVQAAIKESRQAVEVAIRMLQMTAAAGHFLQENRLYKSFRLLQRIKEALPATMEEEDLQDRLHLSSTRRSLPWSISSKSTSTMPREPAKLHGTAAVEKLTTTPNLGNLQNFLRERVDALTKALEAKALADFHDWLVSVRAEARAVGLRVLRRAAAERAREEAAAKERRLVSMQLHNLGEASHAPTFAATPKGSSGAERLSLEPKANPAAAEILAQPIQDTEQTLLGSINMTLLLRCTQVHECLGKLPEFQESYQRNRRLQLNSDLAPPANFLEGYQDFIAQLTGFFIIEDRVQRRCADLCAGAQADAGWETAVAVLKTVLNIALDMVASPSVMLRLKDFVLLVCSALGVCGYHVVPVQEILMAGRTKHQELLCHALSSQLQSQVTPPADPEKAAAWASHESLLLRIEVRDQAVARELAGLGLPLSMHLGDTHDPPFDTPFSGNVPFLARLTRRFVDDCVAYLAGLVSTAEVLPVVRQQRDRMLTRVVIGALQHTLDALGIRDFSKAMQAVTDAWALGLTMPALDEYTVLRVRGGELRERGGPRSPRKDQKAHAMTVGPPSSGMTTLSAAWQTLQENAERMAVKVLAGQASNILSQARAAAWLPELPPKGNAPVSPYISEILQYLENAFSTGARMMPTESYHSVSQAVMMFIGDAVLDLLLDNSIPAYNLYAVHRLKNDVQKLRAFAEASGIPHMAEGLDEPELFCSLMVTNTVEDLLEPNKRSQYPCVFNYKRLISILAKYREIGDKASYTGSHTVMKSKQPESFVKKRQVDRVIKGIRPFADNS